MVVFKICFVLEVKTMLLLLHIWVFGCVYIWVFFFYYLLCDWCTCQCLHMENNDVHVFILGEGKPCKNICIASYPRYDNVLYVILWQNEQTGIKQTSTWRTKTHQAQADVNWMAMTSCGESLNYLFYCMMKQRKNWAVLQQGICLLVCLMITSDTVHCLLLLLCSASSKVKCKNAALSRWKMNKGEHCLGRSR